jgi:hypothetical protein
MKLSVQEFEAKLATKLTERGLTDAAEIAWACAWLEACGYPGVKMLVEALSDDRDSIDLVRGAIGLDLANVSCVFLAPRITRDVEANGRAFLRNVRHGLYMLPFTVRANIGIGCPVDPAFAVGGERTKNPYAEKIGLAERCGIVVDDGLWRLLEAAAR